MRVALVSNSPWVGSGYGQQSSLLLPRLVERYGAGNVAHVSTWGLAGGMLTLDGVVHYPTGAALGSDDMAPRYARHFLGGGPGIVLVLYDCWVFRDPAWQELAGLAAWAPVDHEPVPPAVLEFFAKFRATPIAMSRRGEQLLREAGLDPLYVPLGVDSRTFHPGPGDRARFGLSEDSFVAGMVAANVGGLPVRKSFPEVFQAWRIFSRRHPDAFLYVYTNRSRRPGHHLDLEVIARGIGVAEASIGFVDPLVYELGMSQDDMASMYRCFDVLLAPSMGEGFGIPVVEAQACGVPVVVSDFTAQPELCANGWRVPITPWFNPSQGAYLAQPSVDGIVDALEEAYAARGTRAAAARADTGRSRMVADYDADAVWNRHWKPVLDELEARLPRVSSVGLGAVVPRARAGALLRDLGDRVVAWSPVADDPVCLTPVSAVVLGMLDGEVSAADLVADVGWALGLGEDAAREVLSRELAEFERAGLLDGAAGADGGTPGVGWDVFPAPRDPIGVRDDGSARAVDLELAGTAVRVLCDDVGAAELLSAALADHLVDRRAPVGFVLRGPSEPGGPHLLLDRSGLVLARVPTLEGALAALGSHLGVLLPPPPGTVRIRARALVFEDSTVWLAVHPLLVSPPPIERWLARSAVRLVDRMVVDVRDDLTLCLCPTPWPALAGLGPAPGHASTPLEPLAVRGLLMPDLGGTASLSERVAFLAGVTGPGSPRAERLARAEALAMLVAETVPVGDAGAVYTALERARS